MEKFTVYIGYKTCRKLEETKLLSDKKDLDSFKKSAKSYWDSDVEFKINIKSLIFIHEKLDGGFQSEIVSKLNNIIDSGYEEAIFSRTIEPGLSPGIFTVYIEEDENA